MISLHVVVKQCLLRVQLISRWSSRFKHPVVVVFFKSVHVSNDYVYKICVSLIGSMIRQAKTGHVDVYNTFLCFCMVRLWLYTLLYKLIT